LDRLVYSADVINHAVLLIVTTHPIQYQTPIWQALQQDGRVPFEVWYLTNFGTKPSLDQEFDQTFSWDIETLSGYPHRFLETAEGATPTDFWRCRLRESLRDRLRAVGAKAVWIQGWQVAGYWQTVREAKRIGAEVWLRGESNDLLPVPIWKQPVKRAVLGRLFAATDKFFCIGSANRRLYRKFGVPESRMFAAPYAVDNERFARQAAILRGRRAEVRRAWNIPDDAYCILFCGKFIAKKRPLDLVRAAEKLRASGQIPKVHLLFCGSGDLGGKLRDACAIAYDAECRDSSAPAAPAVDARPRASFTGFLNQTEISRAYVAADCLVLPSNHGETWGLVVNEAMASGLRCVVSDACGCAEDLADDSYPVGNIEALAEKLSGGGRSQGKVIGKKLPAFSDTVAAVSAAYETCQGHDPNS